MPRPGVFVRYRKDMEYAIGFQNVCIFNFGNHIDINIKCTVEKYSVTSQSIRIYNGRNLLCACKIGDECNATLSTSKGEGTIIWMKNGRKFRNNFIIYTVNKDGKTEIPSLMQLSIANVYALNANKIFTQNNGQVPQSIADNPPACIKQCMELLCGYPGWPFEYISYCTYLTGGCTVTDVWDRGAENCKCEYCTLFDFYPLSPLFKGGGPVCPIQPPPLPYPESTAAERYGQDSVPL